MTIILYFLLNVFFCHHLPYTEIIWVSDRQKYSQEKVNIGTNITRKINNYLIRYYEDEGYEVYANRCFVVLYINDKKELIIYSFVVISICDEVCPAPLDEDFLGFFDKIKVNRMENKDARRLQNTEDGKLAISNKFEIFSDLTLDEIVQILNSDLEECSDDGDSESADEYTEYYDFNVRHNNSEEIDTIER